MFCVIIFLWYIHSMNLVELLTEENTIYGMIFLKQEMSICAIVYSVKIDQREGASNMFELNYDKTVCVDMDLVECAQSLEAYPQLHEIPRNQIFFKVLYKSDLVKSLHKDQFMEMMVEDRNVAKDYLIIENMSLTEEYSRRKQNFFIFGITNIDFKNNVLNPHIVLIFQRDRLYIGFETLHPQNFPQEIVHHVKFKSNELFIVGNDFFKSSSLDINYLVFEKLIQDSAESQTILHPCIRKDNVLEVDPEVFKEITGRDMDLNNRMILKGTFMISKCEELIKIAISQKNMNEDITTKANFENMDLPMKTNSKKILKIYTNVIKEEEAEGSNIFATIKKQQDQFCRKGLFAKKKISTNYPSSKSTNNEKKMFNFKCFQLIYLQYIIKNVLNFKGDEFLIANTLDMKLSIRHLIFADPRLGFISKEDISALKPKTLMVTTIQTYTITPKPRVSIRINVLLGVGLPIFLFIFVGLNLFFFLKPRIPFQKFL